MSEPKEYVIETVADFHKVPPEKLAEMLEDFGNYLATIGLAKLVPGCTFPDEPGFCSETRFVWIDDGLHETRVHLTLKGGTPPLR